MDLSTIQLVSPHTSKGELQSLSLEVYKQQRLPGSPPGDPELMEEVVSSFDDCQGQKQGRAPETAARFQPMDIQPPRNQTPQKERRESSVTLEEEIEWLSCPPVRSQSDVRTHSRGRDCQIHKSRGQKRMCHQTQPESCPAPYFKYNPSRRNSESSREVMATKDADLEEPLELGLEVTSFLRGSAENSEEEEKAPSPKPPVKELCKWVTWKAEMCETPDWWRELLAIRGVQDCKELVQKVWALFCHPKRASEVNKMENYYQASPAPPCLLRKNFQLPPDSIFTCQDIQEMQREKTVAYTHALQYWVEKTDLPTGGKPCLLVESVKKLWEEMRCYLSSSDKEVFEDITPPEEMSTNPGEKAEPHSMATMPAIAPGVQATTKAVEEPAAERKCPKFPSWEKVLHPSRPVVAAGQIPHPSESLGWRFHNWEMTPTPPETPSPMREL